MSFAGALGEDWTSVWVLDWDLRAWQGLGTMSRTVLALGGDWRRWLARKWEMFMSCE